MSEINEAPRAVLAHHYPQTPLHGDFTTIQRGDYADIDVLVGGTPCQSFSVAGLRGGMADACGNLALEYLRLAGRLRPRWVVWENVPGVLSSNGGRDFGSFLGGLGQLRYGFAYRVLDAQFFGLAQRRKRVFVVGYLGDWRRAAAVLFEPASLRGNPAPRRKAGKNVAPTISSRPTGGGGLGTDFDLDGGLISMCLTAHPNCMDAETQTLVTSGISPSLRAQPNDSHRMDSMSYVSHSLRGEGFDASEDGTGRGTPIIPCEPYTLAIRGRDGGHDLEWRQDDTSNALLTPSGGRSGTEVGAVAYRTSGNCGAYSTGDQVDALTTGTDPTSHIIAFSSKDHGADAGDIAPTLRAIGHAGSHANGNGQVAVMIQGKWSDEFPGYPRPSTVSRSAVRRLTPKECARLQGFPDDYLSSVMIRSKPMADGPQYKCLGNSWAVPVVRWIGKRIAAEDARATA
jgi:DNA (cytosine-5)-methyltransferase 1